MTVCVNERGKVIIGLLLYLRAFPFVSLFIPDLARRTRPDSSPGTEVNPCLIENKKIKKYMKDAPRTESIIDIFIHICFCFQARVRGARVTCLVHSYADGRHGDVRVMLK